MERKKTDIDDGKADRKPYDPPKIVYREPLEAVATACGDPPAKGSPATCPIGPVSS